MKNLSFCKPDVREKTLEHGITFPFDEELVMLILGSGSKDVPVEILANRIVETLDQSDDGEIIENLQKIL